MQPRLRTAIERQLLLRWGKVAFLMTVPPGGKLLDAGCGNDSPRRIKSVRPDIHYIGIDVGDYNQPVPPSIAADEYIVTSPGEFARRIASFAGQLDAVVSAHNLEHCDEPDSVLEAMASSLKEGGKLYLSFPCEESVNFPHRHGPLNFHQDGSHQAVPCFQKVCSQLQSHGLRIDHATRRHRPFLLSLLGLLLEPASFVLKRTMPFGSTWALYGFESVIWASRLPSVSRTEEPPRLP